MAARKFYIVRLRLDDRIIVVGSRDECAAALNMTPGTFLSTVSRCRRGLNQKYEIDVELEGLDEEND